MTLKNIPDPGFAGDSGSADPQLVAALDRYRDAPGEPARRAEVFSALAAARLLVPVVALLGEAETGPDGLRREKTSDMAVPTIQAPDGRRALPAFTSTEALARWRPDARPVPVPAARAAQAAYGEQADTLLIDLAGPVPVQLTGAELLALAEGRGSADPAADPGVTAALRTLLAGEPAVRRAVLVPGEPGSPTDATLGVELDPALAAEEMVGTVRRLAEALAQAPALRARLVRGLDLAVLEPGSAVEGQWFHP
ncbi:SseB family protein [Allostreptomyces psammosilenae]|uniref:SseB protein N-terminal domain-containing protein n=1 Tax=Allostreptomyces psammosilenae TaxID=1892865 RepID=A0A852ZNQ0_9ACTN|nr:SseB family protein [Allostreptomyces psammosilenae]NYI04019.1 hypothetical protein [Allostreptomyces psammosilenae]